MEWEDMMLITAALRLAGHLNALRHTPLSPEVAARGICGDDVAHHVIDPDGLLGLDQMTANELDAALRAALLLGHDDWTLALPRPGRLAPLRGPAEFNAAALEAGAVVLGSAGGPAWVPQAIGRAVQWRIRHADAPRLTLTPAEAERQLSEAILRSERQLTALGAAAGVRPDPERPQLPSAYPARAQRSAHRALMLIRVCEAGLAEHAGLHSHAVQVRAEHLRAVHEAAIDALCAAVTWSR